MKSDFLRGPVSPAGAVQSLLYKRDFRRAHPEYFDPEGLLDSNLI